MYKTKENYPHESKEKKAREPQCNAKGLALDIEKKPSPTAHRVPAVVYGMNLISKSYTS